MKKIRLSFTVPKEIFEKFEKIYAKMGYKNRSNAISAALHEYIVANKWMSLKGKIAGAILLTYCHHGSINEVLIDVQHEYNDIINASMHIHLDKDNCLEIIAVNGEAKKIKNLLKKLQGIKGVHSAKLVTAA